MATEKKAMDSEPTFARPVLDPSSTTKKHDESPPTNDTNRTVTGSTTSSVAVSPCAKGSDVVSSQPNENGRACATDLLKGQQAARQLSKFANQKTSSVPYSGCIYGNSASGFWDHRDNYRKPERNAEFDSLVELKCGPRTHAKTRPPSESSSLEQNNAFALALRREMFKLPDFQTGYEEAKFFVIKSYSEDDVHKSIKY